MHSVDRGAVRRAAATCRFSTAVRRWWPIRLLPIQLPRVSEPARGRA